MPHARLVLLAGFAAALLSACQPVPPPETTTARPTPAADVRFDQRGRITRQGKGWTMAVHGEDGFMKRHCLASRLNARGPSIAFAAWAESAGILLRNMAAGVTPGETVEVTAAFDDGTTVPLAAEALADGTLAVPVAIAGYDEATYPFAKARRVTFRGPGVAPMRPLSLYGSQWAVNALSDCRILNVAR